MSHEGQGESEEARRRAAQLKRVDTQGSLWACAQHSCMTGGPVLPLGTLSEITRLSEASEKILQQFWQTLICQKVPQCPVQLIGLIKMTSFHAANPFSTRKTC